MQQVYSPYGQYRLQKNHVIASADRVTLIAMLLEGALSYNKKALLALEDKNEVMALESIDYAVRIVLHLYACLNFEDGGEIADRLGKLYNYVCNQYISWQKNLKNTAAIESINNILGTIYEGWKQLPR